ncbi:MAG: carbohydrate kinase family protein [Planctomycetota bacterium]
MPASPSIVGIGVSVLDSICSLERFPKHGEVVRAHDRVDSIGGGITVALATAARLGSKALLIDALGDDSASDSIIKRLSDEGVETRLIERLVGETASTASIWSDLETSERTIVYCPGSACDHIEWKPLLVDTIAGASILHLNGRHPEICKRAIEVAKQHQTTISFDGGAHRYRDEILPMLRDSEVVIVARHFAACHCNSIQNSVGHEPTTAELAAILMNDLQCAIVGVTDGERGSNWVTANQTFHQPAIDTQDAIDTTGCGDSFHGAFLHGLVSGMGVRESAALAAKVASVNARSIGGLGNWSRRDVLP